MMNKTYEIVHDRPVAQTYRPALYPFATMKVNDSFYEPNASRVRALRSAACYWKAKTGKRFTVRRSREGGAWCHRIA